MKISKEKIVFILNLGAGNLSSSYIKDSVPAIIKKVFKNAEIIFSSLEKNRNISNIAYEAQKRGFTTIIGVGGDGTLHQIINGLILPDKSIKIGVLPTGTGNDFASIVGMPKKIEQALEIIKYKTVIDIDLGKIISYKFKKDKYFINTISFGVDAMIANRAIMLKPTFRKIKAVELSYFITLFEAMLKKTKYPELIVKIDSGIKNIQTKISFLVVTNSFRYGKEFKINPRAKINDGLLDMCIVKPITSWEIPYFAWKIIEATHIFSPKFSFHQFQNLEIINSSKFPISVQIDGEVQPFFQPAEKIKILTIPDGLKMIVHPSWLVDKSL